MKNKKGVSMITLMITILVLSLITGIVILTVSDTDIINKATETVNKYNEKQYEIFDLVKDTQKEIEELGGKKKDVLYNGSLEGRDGIITLPTDLDDTSKQYIIDISSALYTGQILLNVYGLEDYFFGATGINSTSNYALEVRHLMLEIEGDLDATTMEGIFGTSDIQSISYYSDGTTATLSYDLANIGSEVTVTKITQVNREYTMFAKLINNLIKGQLISAYDMKEAMMFCINSEVLGYDYLMQELNNMSGSAELPFSFSDTFEMQTLRNIVNTRVRDLTDLEYCITDQVMVTIYATLMRLRVNTQDFYTMATYFEENEWLNEYYYRIVADASAAFTVLFSDYILIDLNEDGVLGGTFNAATEEFAMMLPSGNAGVGIREFADLAATLYPIMIEYNGDMSKMSAAEQMNFEEVIYITGIEDMMNGSTGSIGSNNMQITQLVALPYSWLMASQMYMGFNMDTMYNAMYNSGLTINMAGLKMGWNSLLSEYLAEMLEAETGIRISIPYDFRLDTEAISRQGVGDLVDQLYAYISAVQSEIKGEFSNE